MKPVKLNFIDRMVGVFSPQSLVKRTQSRAALGAYEESGYLNPGGRQKSMKGFRTTAQDPDRDTLPKVDGSRAASRDLYSNSALASALFRRARTNIVGSGLQFQSRVDHEYLGLTLEQSRAWAKDAEREFEAWALSKFADFSGQLNFYELQGLSVVSALMSGDMFFMAPWKKPYRSGNWPYELRLKLIEADLVRNPEGFEHYGAYSSDTGHPGGIERNSSGEMTHVHIANFYPGTHPKEGEKFQRVPVRDTEGRPNIYHLAEMDRVAQRRGMPWLSSVIGPLKQLSRLSEAALMKALVSSMYTVFIKDMGGLGAVQDDGFTPAEKITDNDGDGVKNTEDALDLEMGPASIIYLDDDKEIQIADPKSTDKDFEVFRDALATEISASAEVPVEQVLLMFKGSYSSARAALLEAWKFWRKKRTWLARNFCQPSLEAFLEEAVLKGRLSAPGFFDDPVIKAAWCRGVWVGAGNGQIDPLKETKASQLKIEANLSTHEEEYAADNGGRWDSMAERLSGEYDHIDDLGLSRDVIETRQALEDPNAPKPEDDPEDTNKEEK